MPEQGLLKTSLDGLPIILEWIRIMVQRNNSKLIFSIISFLLEEWLIIPEFYLLSKLKQQEMGC